MSSAGPDAVEFAARSGLVLDDWQAWCLEQMLAENAEGRWAASTILLVIPRQNGKNAILEALELYAFYVLDEPKILHTAHRAKTSADHMRRMMQLVRSNPELDAITHPYVSNGKEALERLDTGARLEFITRSTGASRGGSPSRIVFDEGLILDDTHLDAILPSLSAQSMNADPPQIIHTSSAPKDSSVVLHRLRAMAQSDPDDELFYAEWGLREAVDLADNDALSEALHSTNPGMGIRISEDWVRRNELVQMSAEGFLNERLGYVADRGGNGVIPADAWAGCCVPSEEKPRLVCFAADATPERSSGAIAVAGRRLDGSVVVEVVDQHPGVDWIAGRLVELVDLYDVMTVVVDRGGPAGTALGALERAGVETTVPSSADVAQAAETFFDAVTTRGVVHQGDRRLDVAVAGARQRSIGQAWGWDRRKVSDDVSPLVAVSFALWGLLKCEAAEPQVRF